MALIECPECGKQISDKAEVCIGCGFPISKHIEEQKTKQVKEENEKQKYWCRNCHKQNEIGEDYCVYCGFRLTPYFQREELTINGPETNVLQTEVEKKAFNGIYKYTFFNGKQEVYCPRCQSENCSWHMEQKIIPGKSKTRYTANLNPLKPFTLVNKKEKVVRKDYEYTEKKIICNSCGYIFQ